MTNLRYLYLHHNLLGGEIPPELGNMTGLRYLWLHTSRLTGNIPPELAQTHQPFGPELAQQQADRQHPAGAGQHDRP